MPNKNNHYKHKAMEFYSTIYATIALSLLFYYSISKLFFKPSPNPKAKAPPEAGGARLFTGHVHIMGDGGSPAALPHFRLAALADSHGSIFTIRLGVRRAVVVSSPALARELFTAHDVAVSSRPLLRATMHLSSGLAMFGFAPYGPYWRQMRKLVVAELLSPRRLELQRSVRAAEAARAVGHLHNAWAAAGAAGPVAVDMKRWFGELGLSVVVRVVAGKSLDGGDAAETGRWREVMREFFYLAGVFVPADALPFLGWLDIGGYEKRMKKTAEDFDKIVGDWVAERKEKEYSGENEKAEGFIDVMLSVLKGANLPYDLNTIIKTTCQNLIAGGTDTIAVMLVWALSLLLNNRRVLKKAQDELDKHVGRERRVDESDIDNLVYLQAIVKETLRLYPAGPLGGIREFTKDCNVGGYHVSKGTWLLVNMWKLQRDPQIWPGVPLEFRPERFFESNHKNIDVKGQDFELIPFGAGRRICPGANFGLQMLHLVLANLLQAFELSTVGDEKVDMSESAGLTNLKATPLDVLVAPRLSPTLYEVI